ncbi:hypothetical protein GH714_037827 [Hevea brasiliensis]|uniref:FYVE-type domain-containing protein n=1 Tax=Hevea brasiliensis TaxID=3981 RepID=A0A6A6K8D2_HEVBR|nr:hypothetical protein GH714_037827 [Hevea brasiliensis]
MALEPPHFQEADRCDVCKCSFSTFRRRHHCRRCGRTLCHEHSSNQMALPQFGIHSSVRVCADCFNDSTRSGNVNQQASSDGVNSVADKVSRLDIGSETDSNTETATQHNSATGVIECKCGMPLCICETPAPTMDAPVLQSNPKPKKTDAIPKNRGSTSNNKPSSVFSYGQITNGGIDKPQMDYEVNGEGLREAIKNGDTAAVKKILSEGVDANYRDKQGLSVLHLAALFNQTDIAFTLMESGASRNTRMHKGKLHWTVLLQLCNTR